MKKIDLFDTTVPETGTKGSDVRWFRYRQGSGDGNIFINPAVVLWIAARSADEADAIAQGLGVYFDGVSKGLDSTHRGDRWHSAKGSDGYKLEMSPEGLSDAFEPYIMDDPSVTVLYIFADGTRMAARNGSRIPVSLD